ncbi:septum site-determining protein Ssd [Mycobacterium sp. NPDC003323]
MTTTTAVLALVDDPSLREDVDRVAAAAGLRVVHTERPAGRTAWLGAVAVVLDVGAADRCALHGLPRRDRVLMVGRAEPGAAEWRAAACVGAQHFYRLPEQDEQLVEVVSEAADHGAGGRAGAVLAVLGGCGGAGASLFATALAQSAEAALLIDADPWSGGIDLAMGTETISGLRWPDLTLRDGRLGFDALRAALPTRRAVTVLSGGRDAGEIAAGPLAAVIDAGRRAGVTVVCDTPRRTGPTTETALESADLVVLIAPADVRAAAAAGALAGWVRSVNPNIGLVVRGPSPGGLRAEDLAAGTGLPLLAAMRPQPGLAGALERGGLRLGARSPLATAAAQVLKVLHRQPVAA